MAKLSAKNINQASPSWLVNVTAVMAVLATIMPELVEKMPGTVSDVTKEWIHWILTVITALFGVTTALSKSSRIIGGRPNDR